MRLALFVSLCGLFVSNLTLTVLTVALPYISRDLQAAPAAANWVTLGPMLVVALLTPAAARAADVFGRKRVWLLGLAGSLVGMATSALAPSLLPLLLARLVTGVGSALLMPAGLAIATDLYPPEKRAIPIGYWTSIAGISPLAGVLLGGALLEAISWRWLFVVQLALALPTLVAAALCFEERRFPQRGRFDREGSLAIGLAALAAMLAATWFGAAETRSTLAPLAALGAIVACAWSVNAERRAEQPVFPPALLSEPIVSLSLLARACLTFSYMGAFMILPYLLKELWQLSALAISGLLIWRPLAMGLAGPVAGRLAERVGSARLVIGGGYCILLSSAAFVWLDAQPARALLVGALAVAGLGLGLSAPGTVAVVSERISSAELGTLSALTTLGATLANALGMALMFAVVEAQGGVGSAAAYRSSFVLGTLVAGVGVAASHLLAVHVARTPGPFQRSLGQVGPRAP